jgi:hypothetical protein
MSRAASLGDNSRERTLLPSTTTIVCLLEPPTGFAGNRKFDQIGFRLVAPSRRYRSVGFSDRQYRRFCFLDRFAFLNFSKCTGDIKLIM